MEIKPFRAASSMLFFQIVKKDNVEKYFFRKFHRRKNAEDAAAICAETEMQLATSEDAYIFEGRKRLSTAFQWAKKDIEDSAVNCNFDNIFEARGQR